MSRPQRPVLFRDPHHLILSPGNGSVESRIHGVEPSAEFGNGRRDVEIGAGEVLDVFALGKIVVQFDHRDLIKAVTHDVEGSTVQQYAVSVGQRLIIKVNCLCHASQRINAEENAGAALDRDKESTVNRSRDTVKIKTRSHFEITTERPGNKHWTRGDSTTSPECHDVDKRVERIGEVRGLVRDHDIVDKARHGGEAHDRDVRSGRGIIDERAAARASRYKKEVRAPVVLHPQREAIRFRRHQDAALAGSDIAFEDRSLERGLLTRAREKIRAAARGNSFGSPTRRQIDHFRETFRGLGQRACGKEGEEYQQKFRGDCIHNSI